MKKTIMRKLIKQKKGQALVELALILPIILIILFGIIEFGRIYGASLTVNYSAREGARLGVTGATDSEINTRVVDASPNLDATKLAITIVPEQAVRQRGEEISVRVSYPVEIIVPVISAITGDMVTVQANSVMRVE